MKLRATLDTLHLKTSSELGFAGASEIYLLFTVSSGAAMSSGRWPASGTVSMVDEETLSIATVAANVAAPPATGEVTVHLRVLEQDSLLDDLVGEATYHFDAASGFGSADITHVRDEAAFRVGFSLVHPQLVSAGGPCLP
jgi:hypothetical protein